MAETNEEALGGLLAEIETESEALRVMLEDLARSVAESGENDPEVEWQGMPEFESEEILGNAITCLVRFKSEDDRLAFENLLGYKLILRGNTYSTWYPKADFDQSGTKAGIVYGES